MADELDVVDIEGDDYDNNSVGTFEEGGLLQDQFLQSAWKTSTGILPWELDSSISAENREVIESMLLEEQYYLTGRDMPQNGWTKDPISKPKAKKSPARPAASGPSSSTTSRWSLPEKELFEEGLAQFGRRWTKISKLVGSRTVLQVKSYARQYFKHKTKPAAGSTAPPTGQVVKTAQSTESSSSHVSALANAVRIEKLSDDEEVDITDSPSDEEGSGRGERAEPAAKPEPGGSAALDGAESQSDSTSQGEDSPSEPSQRGTGPGLGDGHQGESRQDRPEDCPPSPLSRGPSALCPSPERSTVRGLSEEDLRPGQGPEAVESRPHSQCGSPEAGEQPEESCTEGGEADQDEEEEGEELKVPEQEVQMDMVTITEEEKQAIPEFFEGRPSKNPDRYLRIRNYILDQWVKSKPRYLNKTSVRPGLKNCGDVNCIGRIHTYLELIGAINFNCEQAVYNRPRVTDRSRLREGRDALEAYQLAQRLQSMRTRKRRVRDIWGNWRDSKDLEGQTYEHLSAEELSLRREEMKRQPRPCKIPRHRGYDPFQLIPCRSFGEQQQEPFQVTVCAEALLIMDMHAHVSRGEVIGLLGGAFSERDKVLKICAAEPCNSVSTGLQCEMDPLSQTQACELLSSLGLSVVGWYHSHPTFHPNPSQRDIHTQDQFQRYFSRGGAPFIGMIVSPFDPANPSPHSQTTCLVVREDQGAAGPQKLPYRFDFLPSQEVPDWDQLMRRAQWIVRKYSQAHGRVQMDRFFRRDSHLTCLEKMLSSLARYLEPLPDEEGDPFLTQIQALFQAHFVATRPADEDEGGASHSPAEAVDPDAFPFSEEDEQEADEQIGLPGNGWDTEAGRQSPETERSPVLHLGSVLLTGHDYLF